MVVFNRAEKKVISDFRKGRKCLQFVKLFMDMNKMESTFIGWWLFKETTSV